MNQASIYKSEAGRTAVMALYDAALAQWPLPYETAFIPTSYGETFVLTCGLADGPPLILLHGAGTNSAMWIEDIAEYGRVYRIIAVDLLGEAGKSSTNRPDWRTSVYADWLAELLDSLQINRATFVGISQGGWVALQFAARYPERAARLALLCPGGVVADRPSFIIKAIALSLLGEWGLRRLTRLLYGRQPIPDGVDAVMRIVTAHFKPRIGVLPLFADAELERLTMPVGLWGGEVDAMRDITAIASRLRLFAPDLTVTVIPNAGHILLRTARLIMSFLDRSQASSALPVA